LWLRIGNMRREVNRNIVATAWGKLVLFSMANEPPKSTDPETHRGDFRKPCVQPGERDAALGRVCVRVLGQKSAERRGPRQNSGRGPCGISAMLFFPAAIGGGSPTVLSHGSPDLARGRAESSGTVQRGGHPGAVSYAITGGPRQGGDSPGAPTDFSRCLGGAQGATLRAGMRLRRPPSWPRAWYTRGAWRKARPANSSTAHTRVLGAKLRGRARPRHRSHQLQARALQSSPARRLETIPLAPHRWLGGGDRRRMDGETSPKPCGSTATDGGADRADGRPGTVARTGR